MEALDAVMLDFVGIDDPIMLAKLRSDYEAAYEKFVKLLLPMMSWAIAARRAGEDVVLGLDDGVMNKCCEVIALETVGKANATATFRERCKGTNSVVPQKDIDAVEAELALLPPKYWLRGKFELWFFVKFINAVWTELVCEPITPRRRAARKSD